MVNVIRNGLREGMSSAVEEWGEERMRGFGEVLIFFFLNFWNDRKYVSLI